MTKENFSSVEKLWQMIKKEQHPLVSGQQEKDLKTMFLNGLHAGEFFVTEIVANSDVPDATAAIKRFREQISAEMERLGYVRKKPTNPKVVASIAGQRIKDN